MTATSCDTTGIDAAGTVACSSSQTAIAPAAPQGAPASFGTATVANGPLDIRCADDAATLSPGLYSETATSGITVLLNALTASTAASSVTQSTTVRTTTNAGATSLPVNERKGFRAGDRITVGGATGEVLTIKSSYTATTGAGSVTLAAATTKKWTSGTGVTGATCVLNAGSPCNGSGGTAITRLILSPGTFFFDLNANWTVDNPSLTVVGGIANASGSTARGDLCVAPTDQTGPNGVVLAFDGGSTSGSNNASGYGLVVSRGTVALCANAPVTSSDRPVAIYGPTTSLTGSYRKVGATSNTSYTFAARGTSCAIGTKTNCSIVSVTTGGHLFLYGSVHAPNDDVALVAGPYDDDQLLLYGVVADAISVTTEQVPGDGAQGPRPLIGLPRPASDALEVGFTAYRCTSSCPSSAPASGRLGEATVLFVPMTVGGLSTRSATVTGPLSVSPFWQVTG